MNRLREASLLAGNVSIAMRGSKGTGNPESANLNLFGSRTRAGRRGPSAALPALVLAVVVALSTIGQAQTLVAYSSSDSLALASAPGPVESSAVSAEDGNNATNAAQGNGVVEGVATGDEGEVYEGVRVELAGDGPHPGSPTTETTGADGTFKFTNVGAGAFRLTLTSPGFATRVVTGTLHPGETFEAHNVVLGLEGASSVVRVSASQADIAQEQVRIQETQRVLGVVPNYYVSYDHDAAPMTTRQKWQLTWKSDVDPVTVAATGIISGIEQADNVFPGYGQGAAGYSKRFAANYGSTLINTVIGSAILPSLLHQDPRYFYKGTGTVKSRIWYAIANSVMCRGDNGRWQPNYSAIVGGLASGALANLYYPASDVGWGVTFEGAALGTATGAVQNLFQEFVVKKLTPRARKLAY